MKLWLVTRTDNVGYDEFDGFVVRATTAKRAAEMAAERSRRCPWSTAVVTEVQVDGDEAIILESFNAG